MAKLQRGHNEGSIYQRKDGRWVAQVSLPNGRRRSLYGTTRSEVSRQLKEALSSLESGMLPLDRTITVQQFLARWLDEVVRVTVRPTTLRSYEMHIERHINPAVGRLKLAQLQPTDVQRCLNQLEANGLAPATVHRIRSTLRSALNTALRWGLVGRNAATLVVPPRLESPEIVPYTVEEALAILEAAKGDPLEHLFRLAFMTGLREGELFALAWDAVDLQAATLKVRWTLVRVDGTPRLPSPKSRRSRRTIKLAPQAIEAFHQQRKVQDAYRLLAGPRWSTPAMPTGDRGEGPAVVPDLVFTNQTGAPLHGSYTLKRFKAIVRSAGLPEKRIHDLRHSHASFLLALGFDIRSIMEQLGHSSISLTVRYAHVAPALMKAMADGVGGAFAAGERDSRSDSRPDSRAGENGTHEDIPTGQPAR